MYVEVCRRDDNSNHFRRELGNVRTEAGARERLVAFAANRGLLIHVLHAVKSY